MVGTNQLGVRHFSRFLRSGPRCCRHNALFRFSAGHFSKARSGAPGICLLGHEFLTFRSPKQYSQVMMSGDTVTPDLKWYEEVTKRKGLKEPRCPFASVEKCPRYYQSLSLLGAAGATAIDKAEDEKLQKKWERHHLW